MVIVRTCRLALSLTKEKMEQTLKIAFNSTGKGHYDSSSRREKGNLEVISDKLASLIYLNREIRIKNRTTLLI